MLFIDNRTAGPGTVYNIHHVHQGGVDTVGNQKTADAVTAEQSQAQNGTRERDICNLHMGLHQDLMEEPGLPAFQERGWTARGC